MPAYFTTTKNGYNPDEVDRHISNIESVINNYKEKDAAISSAIVNAQIAADNIIKNAELAAEDIRKNAVEQLEKIEDSLDKQRKLISELQDDYNALANKYIQKVNEDDFKQMLTKVDTLDKFLTSLKNTKPAGTNGQKNGIGAKSENGAKCENESK